MKVTSGRFDRIVLASLAVFILLIAVLSWFDSRPVGQAPESPKVLYLAPGGSGADLDQIYLLVLEGSPAVQITQESYGVFDFTPSPDGRSIAYSAYRPDGGTDLWLTSVDGRERRLLFACYPSTGRSSYLPLGCSEPAWEPNGRRLAFTQRKDPQSPQLWWLEVEGAFGEALPVFADDTLGQMASWSPDGSWLGYISPTDDGLKVFNVSDGSSILISNQTEAPAAWRPKGESLLATSFQFTGEKASIQLLRADLASGELTALTETPGIEYGSPAWSADGEWIVFGRKQAQVPAGRQLWLARADGSDARPLTNESEFHHAMPSWSADGQQIMFQRSSLFGDGVLPGIWLLSVESGELVELASPGYRPVWLP